jgi:hypothetical protein
MIISSTDKSHPGTPIGRRRIDGKTGGILSTVAPTYGSGILGRFHMGRKQKLLQHFALSQFRTDNRIDPIARENGRKRPDALRERAGFS